MKAKLEILKKRLKSEILEMHDEKRKEKTNKRQ